MKKYLFQPILPCSNNVLVLLILLIAIVGFVSMDIYFPSLPAISESFQISMGTAQSTLTWFLFGFGFSQLFYGPLSDSYGRRSILLAGFLTYLFATTLLIFANKILLLLIARFLQGVGAGAGASLCRVLLRDNFVGNKMSKVASYITLGIALATALAPAAGGYIQQYGGYTWNFKVMLLFGLLVTLLIFIYLPETNLKLSTDSLNISDVLKRFKSLLVHKTFMCNLLCSGLALSVLISYAMIYPFYLQGEFSLSPASYGLAILIIASGELVGTYINAKLVEVVNFTPMMLVGIALITIAATILLIFTILNMLTVNIVMLATFFITMSIGIIIPNATAGAFANLKNSIGSAGAIYGFLQILVTLLVTYCITTFSYQAQHYFSLIFLGHGILMLIIYALLNLKK